MDKYFNEINKFPVREFTHRIHGFMKFMHVEAL